MNNLHIVVFSSLILSGCVSAQSTKLTPTPAPVVKMLAPIKLTSSEVAAVRSAVKASLKDPDSAKFGGMIAGRDDDGIVRVCLHVNAKNSYGGYTGMKPITGIFAGQPAKTFIVSPVPPELAQFADQAAYEVCEKRGLAIPAASGTTE